MSTTASKWCTTPCVTLLAYLIRIQRFGSAATSLNDNIHLLIRDALVCHMKAICKPSFVSLLRQRYNEGVGPLKAITLYMLNTPAVTIRVL